MLRRLIAIATIVAPLACACAGVLGLDPGTLREDAAAADAGGEDAAEDTAVPVPPDAAPRGCAKALATGSYCDDFDEPGRTDPSAREAKATDAPEKLSLVTTFAKSSPRSLQAKYLNTGFPQGYLTMPWTVAGNSFHITMAVRVAREDISVGDAFAIAQLFEVPGRDGIAYTIHLTPRQEAVEVRLKAAATVLAFHQKTIPYDEWHEVSMRFNARYAYLEVDGDAVSEGTPELTGDYDVSFGLNAFAPATVFLDDVEIGP